MYPELQTGLHASPPCVMEEDFQFRKLTLDLGVESVDNEAAQIAALIFGIFFHMGFMNFLCCKIDSWWICHLNTFFK